MAATIFRATGFDTEGDLELSVAHLYAGAERADLGATISSSHTPIVGAVSTLANGDLNTVCRFAAQDVQSPGFYIQWTLPAAAEVSRIRLGAGGDSRADTRQITLSTAHSRAARTWTGLQATGRMSWYAEEPARLVARAPFVPETIEASSVTASCALPGNCLPGDYLLAFVMHRSALTTPTGWTLLRTVGPVNDGAGTNQWQTLLGKVAAAEDLGGSLTVVQAATGRLILGVACLDTKGTAVEAQTLSDSAMGATNQYIDALAVTIGAGSVAVASATMIAISTVGGTWTFAPLETTPLFGATTGLDRRLVAAISANSGAFGPRFVAPSVEIQASAAVTKITVVVNPSADSLVLKEGPLRLKTRAHGLLAHTGAVPAPQGMCATHKLLSPQKLLDAEAGGFFRLYGTVARKGTPANVPLKRRVRLHRSKDGYLVRETWSQPDGSYEFKEISGRYEYDVIAWDHELQDFSTVANNQQPEVMP